MPIVFTAVEITPYRLLYRVTTVAQEVGPLSGIITNRTPPGTGLRTDSGLYSHSPLNDLVSTPTPTTTDARRVLLGNTQITNASIEFPRLKLSITARSQPAGNALWSANAVEGAAAGDALSAGFAVIVVGAPNTDGLIGYVDLHFKHTYQR